MKPMQIQFQTDKKRKIVDCRQMFSPEPMEKVLEAVETLNEDEAIVMIHRHEPVPLYKRLQERACDYQTKHLVDGSVQVLIWKKDDEDR